MWSLCRAPLKGPDASSLVITLNVRDSRYACVVQELVSMAGEVSRNAAANRVHLSSSWFSHEFKNVFGMSFRTAQSVAKLHVAALFLVVSSARISEIADCLRYSEPKKFTAAFKSRFQVSPRTYRTVVTDSNIPLRQLQYLFSGRGFADASQVRPLVCPTCHRPLARFTA